MGWRSGRFKTSPGPISDGDLEARGDRVAASKALLGSLQLVSCNLAGTAVRYQLEGELLAVLKLAEACTLNSGNVNENVRTAIIRRNEAVTLGRIEPLNCTRRHIDAFLCNDRQPLPETGRNRLNFELCRVERRKRGSSPVLAIRQISIIRT